MGGFDLLSTQYTVGLCLNVSTPILNILLKWSKLFWLKSCDYYSRLSALACFCIIQNILNLSLELKHFFSSYLRCVNLSKVELGAPLFSSRRKRFFFVNQQPKRYVLWYWGVCLAQGDLAASTLHEPSRVLRVLFPASLLLTKKKLMRPKKKKNRA